MLMMLLAFLIEHFLHHTTTYLSYKFGVVLQLIFAINLNQLQSKEPNNLLHIRQDCKCNHRS